MLGIHSPESPFAVGNTFCLSAARLGRVLEPVICLHIQVSCSDDAAWNPLPSCHNVASGVACYTKSTNVSWRYNLLCLGGICLAIFSLRFVVFNFKNPPNFCYTRGRMRRLSRFSATSLSSTKAKYSISPEIFEDLIDENSSPAS